MGRFLILGWPKHSCAAEQSDSAGLSAGVAMVGRTLADIRARLDELSVAVGPYRVVSSRTGFGPFPVTGLQFPDRETATEAATVATAYRRALRRYDSDVTRHGLIVTESCGGSGADEEAPQSLPEYCHRVAGALFETLSARHGPVERSVMDTYLRAAETTGDRERLCLQMLESTAVALDGSLTASEQASVLLAAAHRLPSRATTGEPLSSTAAELRRAGLLRDATVEPTAEGPGRRTQRVRLDGYRPALDDDRCPVLPVVVELLRHTSVVPCIDSVRRTESGWELRVSMAGDSPARGLAVAAASR